MQGRAREILVVFIAWRVWVTVFASLGLVLFPLAGRNFFGGGLDNYLSHPLFWGWSNFDGEHYISIAQRGYQSLQHSFFPLYPLAIRLITPGQDLSRLVFVGIILSNLAFLLSLWVFWKLLKIDYSSKTALLAVIIWVLFPTSFFMAGVYTGALFGLFVLGAFYFARQRRWLYAALLAALASATRVQGLMLIGGLFVEWLIQTNYLKNFTFKKNGLPLILILLSSLGFLVYVGFLYKTTGNPLSFYTDLAPYGQQREIGTIVLLPQVFWRYIKIFLTLSPHTPLFFTVSLEFVAALLGMVLLVVGWFKKVRLSYLAYASASYILPTLTGSFSSLPRYMLVVFPFFIVMALVLDKAGRLVKLSLFVASAVLLALETMMFVTGYWVG